MYEVIDSKTGLRVGGLVKTLRAAARKVDRLDNAYGGYRYSWRRVVVVAPIGSVN